MRAWGLVGIGVLACGVARAERVEGGERVEAGAERRFEGSAFVGYASFGHSQLGNSWAADQVPGSGMVVGARASWLVVPRLVARGSLALSLSLEAELDLATAITGDAPEMGRRSYFAPVFGWRAHALVRQASLGGLPDGEGGELHGLARFGVHALLGAGGATVVSSSPFMADETDPVAYVGFGITYALGGRWHARADARWGVMPGRDDRAAWAMETQLGVTARFGRAAEVRRAPAVPVAAVTPPAPRDTDGDGIRDPDDRCPTEAETVNGLADDDGCPEADPDADGIVGAADACPMEPEDIDKFQDDDGCPDPDNDGDGVPDRFDLCPLEPETRNGFSDGDGCRDVVPARVMRALAFGSTVKFAPGRARVSDAAKAALRPLLNALVADGELRVIVTGAPDRAGHEDLAKRRAEAVKWHLVDEGLAADRIETAVGSPAKAPIAVTLRVEPAPAPAPTPTR